MTGSNFEDFYNFHRDNPHVYRRLVEMTRQAKAQGQSKIGIGMLFEVLRWEHMISTTDAASEFKLNNNYRPFYARLIMVENPDLDGLFETRVQPTMAHASEGG